MKDFQLSDLLDMSLIQRLADSNFRASGLPLSIIDAQDTSILVQAGWTDICLKFHRANPASRRRCQESDASVSGRLVEGEAYQYRCKNGLWHIAMPIMVAGRHLATMFLTQFFFEGEVPERQFFVKQARQFGYDLKAYLAALEKMPIFSRAKVNYIIAYDLALVRFIADLAEQSLRVLETRRSLHRSEEQYRTLVNNVNIGVFRTAIGRDQFVQVKNPAMARLFGYDTVAELMETPVTHLYQNPAERQKLIKEVERHGVVKDWELRARKKDGTLIWCSITAAGQFDDHGDLQWIDGVVEDITVRKQATEELQRTRAELESRVKARTAELAQANNILQHEIIQHKLAEEALIESEERYNWLLEHSPEPIFLYSQGKFVYINPAGIKFVRADSQAQIIGQPIMNFVHPDYLEIAQRRSNLMEQGLETTPYLELKIFRLDGQTLDVEATGIPITYLRQPAVQVIIKDIGERKRAEAERERLISELQKALANVKQLSGLLPICSHCKKIRDDQGYWQQLEAYIDEHSEARFSHGICPDCLQKFYPKFSGRK